MIRTGTHGFTLIETLVAISILLVAVVGPMTIAAQGLQNAFYAREQVTAYLLGQEAIEILRSIRDENAIAGASWLAGVPETCAAYNFDGCGVDVRTFEFTDCGESSDACQINYDSGALSADRGFYTHEAGDGTAFTRRMWVDEVAGDQEAAVTVRVSWTSGIFAGERTVTLQTYLFNHYDNI